MSEEGEIPVDPEEMEEMSKAQQQAVSKQTQHHSPAPKQVSDRGRDRDRDRGSDRDKGHPGRDRQAFSLCQCSLHWALPSPDSRLMHLRLHQCGKLSPELFLWYRTACHALQQLGLKHAEFTACHLLLKVAGALLTRGISFR